MFINLFDIPIFLNLILIAYIDYKHQYIYNSHLISLCVLISMSIIGVSEKDIWSHCQGAMFGYVFTYMIYKTSFYYYNDEVFGFGDVLLMSNLGLYLAMPSIINYIVFFHFLSGAICIIFYIATRKNTSIPLAPFYVCSFFLYLALNQPTIIEMCNFLSRFKNF